MTTPHLPALDEDPALMFQAVKQEIQNLGITVPPKGGLTRRVRLSILSARIFGVSDPSIIARSIAHAVQRSNEGKLLRFVLGGSDLAAARLN